MDSRSPTFLVIDEAHNLAPKTPLSRTGQILLDQVRTIVAEGRKYGLFVVLVSQRPDKLDDLVLSECENIVIMKLSNPGTLEEARKLLNLDIDDGIKQQILTMEKGRARIFGRWSSEARGEALYCAARRTVQGGADLRQDHWATATEGTERL
jgi:DNA helicase HerA-like ATPase